VNNVWAVIVDNPIRRQFGAHDPKLIVLKYFSKIHPEFFIIGVAVHVSKLCLAKNVSKRVF